MSPEAAGEFEQLLDPVDSGTLVERAGAATGGGAVRFRYELTIAWGGERQLVTLDEPAVPRKLRPLIDRLLQEAKRRR